MLGADALGAFCGGSCANIGCVEGGDCVPGGGGTPCATKSTTCKFDQKLQSCVKITTVRHNECLKRLGYENCQIQLGTATCATYYAGSPMPMGTKNCPDYTCLHQGRCGENHQICSSDKCQD
jgi:hypothetical protein